MTIFGQLLTFIGWHPNVSCVVIGDTQGEVSAHTYGQQLWNYFAHSYPDLVGHHYD